MIEPRRAYIDTSWLIAARFEANDDEHLNQLLKYDALFSSELLLAEVLAFANRMKLDVTIAREAVQLLTWVIPDRSIHSELEKVDAVGYLRGADLWHLACACYVSPRTSDLDFLTRDALQQRTARKLGFKAPSYKE